MEHSATGVTGVYDPRGANVGTEEPDQSGFVDGTAGRGASDPSLYTRCAEGGAATRSSGRYGRSGRRRRR